MGMARWLVDNNKYDTNFLSAPSKAAAAKVNELTWTDSTYLVNTTTRAFVRPADVGLAGETTDYVVSVGGSLAVHSSVDLGDLFVTTTVDGVVLKSVFQMVVERLQERTIAEYAALAGVDESLIIRAAQEFAAGGKQSVANMYRGTCQNRHASRAKKPPRRRA